jgi:hypothetical protein
MRSVHHRRGPRGWPLTFRSSLWGPRASLIGGVIAYLALAMVAIRWRPDEPFITAIFLFFAAHTAAHLLIQEVRKHQDEGSS